MKAVLCHGLSGPADPRIGDAPDPAPPDDEILLDDIPRLTSARRR